MNILKTAKAKFESLPDKKKYLELVSAFLSVPVLITVVLINLNNLKRTKQTEDINGSQPTPTAQPSSINLSPTAEVTIPVCKNEIGPIEIAYPQENQLVTDNPFCLEIVYKDESYCPVVWSYRMNSTKWSDYSDKSVCIYNLESGEKKLDLKVKSLSKSNEIILTRDFVYKNEETVPTPTPLPTMTPTSTPTPTLQPTLTPIPSTASPSGVLQ